MTTAEWTFEDGTCDKRGCSNHGAYRETCRECGKKYQRCFACGGGEGAGRSLKSHMGLHHPKGTGIE